MAKAGGYKSKLLEVVKSLSEERIKALADFAAYLRGREEGRRRLKSWATRSWRSK